MGERRMRWAPLLVVLALAGCAPAPGIPDGQAAPVLLPPSDDHPGVRFVDDVAYGDGPAQRLDVCLPPGDGPHPAVLSVHGGGWREGDKAQRPWRESCAWLASEGFAVFQANYRLAPEHVFPAGLDDLTLALDWLADPSRAERFGHDPERIAGFGDSAGGNLIALLAMTGPGLDAVVDISAPVDLTAEGSAATGVSEAFQRVQLDYLGCATYAECPVAEAASPLLQVHEAAPPFLVVHARDDFIPHEQSELLVAALAEAGADAELVSVPGGEHALGVLDDDLRARIASWLRERLA